MKEPPRPPAQFESPRELFTLLSERIKLRHFSPRTERAYVYWARRYLSFHKNQDPRNLGQTEVEAFLTSLAVKGKVASATQNQALAALLFLYKEILGTELPWMDRLVRAKTPRRLPVVMTPQETQAVLHEMKGTPRLLATLLYGAGLRLMEGCRLRVKDLDFERREVHVREGKGGHDRKTMLPGRIVEPLRRHLKEVHQQHREDLEKGWGSVALPGSMAEKTPRAPWEWPWQWVFPATSSYFHQPTSVFRRHHLHLKWSEKTEPIPSQF